MCLFKPFQINYNTTPDLLKSQLAPCTQDLSVNHLSIQVLNLLSCSGSQGSGAYPSMQWVGSRVQPGPDWLQMYTLGQHTGIQQFRVTYSSNKHVIAVTSVLSASFNASLMNSREKKCEFEEFVWSGIYKKGTFSHEQHLIKQSKCGMPNGQVLSHF